MVRRITLVLLLLPCFLYAQEQPLALDLGSVGFFLDTKITDDGSITDAGLSIDYNSVWGGEIRFRGTKVSANNEMEDEDVEDSLIAFNESTYEIFFLPIKWFRKNENNKFWLGAGLYYEYQKSDEKGFVDMPFLETDFGLERVNSTTDDFSMHVVGPLLDAGVKYKSEWFTVNFSGGIVPVFFLSASEKYHMFPLMAKAAEHSQQTSGSPYFYLNLDSILFKYIGLAVLYNFSNIKYQVIDFDKETGEAIFPDSTVVNHSLMFEISALIPLGGMSFQIGYGHMLDYTIIDGRDPWRTNKNFLILSGKKIGF